MKTTKIYTLSDPVTNEIRYVGKTEKSLLKRFNEHLSKKDRTYKSCWIQSLLSTGNKPIIELLDEVRYEDWIFWEQYWIFQLKSWGVNLTNLTKGGDGISGYKHTIETRQKLIIASSKKRKLTPVEYKKFGEMSMVPIVELDLKGNLVKEWKSATTAGKNYGISVTSIVMCLRGKTKTSNESIWIYKNNYDEKLDYHITNTFHIRKPVDQFDLNMNFIKSFKSLSQVRRELGFATSDISSVCKGKLKQCYGFKWKYAYVTV